MTKDFFILLKNVTQAKDQLKVKPLPGRPSILPRDRKNVAEWGGYQITSHHKQAWKVSHRQSKIR